MITTNKKLPSNLSIHVHVDLSETLVESIRIKAASEAAFICTVVSPTSNYPLIDNVFKWFFNYLLGKPPENNLPINLASLTTFQQKVLTTLLKTTLGSTLSYQALAEKVGSPKACRAVGNACHKNPFPIYIPCHRVINESGKTGNYAFGSLIKELLLNFELSL